MKTPSLVRATGFAAALTWAIAGCSGGTDAASAANDDAQDATFLDPAGKADAFGVAEKTPAALGILRLVNESDLATLTTKVGVSSRSANGIVAARIGDDGELGTHDDHEVVTLAELDAIDWVGPKTFGRLQKYAKNHGFIQSWSLRHTAHGSVMAIGDLHGDIDAARRALLLAGAMDESEHWIGGDMVLVQVGDVLDRGDGEREILDLLDRLGPEAKAAGGELIPLLGNHEMMNVALDFSYVTPAGFTAFEDVPDLDFGNPLLDGIAQKKKARAASFVQGGPFARRLARQSTIVIVGDTLFVHGGVLPKHVDYGLDAINYDAKAWMLWDDLDVPAILDADDSPVWYRGYGEAADTDCTLLETTLAAAGAKRMVVAHTPQLDGITTDCDGKLHRIDTGMSDYYGGPVEVLELDGPDAWVLSEQ
jgi:hypothetical protein